MIIWTITKIAIVAGTVWLTKQYGVWDSPDKTTLIYEDVKSQLKPYSENLKKKYCQISEESTKPWRESWINAWNLSIKSTFIELSQMPQYCTRFTEDVQKSINQFITGDGPQKVGDK